MTLHPPGPRWSLLTRAVAAGTIAGTISLATVSCTSPGRITIAKTATTTSADRPTTSDPSGNGTAGAPGTGDGAADVGDAITPGAGNGGYDVDHYDLGLDVSPDRRDLDATVTIEARATEDLRSFHLDLAGLELDRVRVDGAAATTRRDGDEVIVTPRSTIEDDATFTTVVEYSGRPEPVADPSAPGTIGWLTAPSGSFVAAEPVGAKSFLPCNDHPSDKATFTIRVTAASTDTVVANGTLTSRSPAKAPGRTTWTFDQTDPMATYLVQVAVGDYDLVESTGPHGLPIRHAIARHVAADRRIVLDETAAQIEFFEQYFGPFPLDNYGLLVADSTPEFALETQTLTLLPVAWLESSSPTETSAVMAHELAHQWFGDSVTPSRWGDIWLNEGFATYAEWMWNERQGIVDVATVAAVAHNGAALWRENLGPVIDPEPTLLFSPNQYDGAAVVLQALRLTVGDEVFFRILSTWSTEEAGRSVTSSDFEATASRLAGTDLTSFFDSWLRSRDLPPLPG